MLEPNAVPAFLHVSIEQQMALTQDIDLTLATKARAAGRDAACLFRSQESKSVHLAAILAKRLLLSQCPLGFLKTAVSAFNSETDGHAVSCVSAGYAGIIIKPQDATARQEIERRSKQEQLLRVKARGSSTKP